jgi:SPP1 gp7 family putative phage head morphogenesis protein
VSRISATVAGFRRRLARDERRAVDALLRAYGEAWREVQGEIDRLTREIAARRAAGEPLTPAWLYQARRLDRILAHIEATFAAATRSASPALLEYYRAAVEAATADARALLIASLPPSIVDIPRIPINVPAVERIIAVTEQGPLRELLDRTAPSASRQVREALVRGVITGQHPREIARRARRASGVALSRAMTIARTEALRAYRATLLETYRANSHITRGWIWHSTLDSRCCPYCWARHGQRFRLDTPMAAHPNCRCTPVPEVRSWAEIGRELGIDLSGIPETAPVIERGSVQFAALPEAMQRRILGPAKFRAYQDGALRLEDLIGVTRSRDWGTTGRERSLSEVLGPDRAQAYYRAAREDAGDQAR